MSPTLAIPMGFALAAAHAACCYVAGRPAVALLAPRLAAGIQVAASLLVGCCLLGAALALVGAAGVPWGLPTVLAILLVTVICFRHPLAAALRSDAGAAAQLWRQVRRSPGMTLMVVLVVAALALYSAALAVQPVEGNDGIANFLFKAKLFWSQQRVGIPFPFNDPDRHLDYPVGLPLAMDTVYAIAGGLSEHLGRSVYVTFAGALAVGSLSTFRRLANGAWAVRLTVLLVTMPAFAPAIVLPGEMGYADFPLACAIFLSACALVVGRDGLALSLALGLVAATLKLEGQVWLVGLVVVLGAGWLRGGLRGRGRRGWSASWPGRGGAAWLALIAASAAWWPLLAMLSGWGSRYTTASLDPNFNGDLPHRLVTILTFAISTVGIRYDTGWWAIAVVLSVQLALFARHPGLKMVAALIAWQGGTYLVTYLVTHDGLVYLLSTTIYRLYMHLAPLLVLGLVLALEPSGVLRRPLVELARPLREPGPAGAHPGRG